MILRAFALIAVVAGCVLAIAVLKPREPIKPEFYAALPQIVGSEPVFETRRSRCRGQVYDLSDWAAGRKALEDRIRFPVEVERTFAPWAETPEDVLYETADFYRINFEPCLERISRNQGLAWDALPYVVPFEGISVKIGGGEVFRPRFSFADTVLLLYAKPRGFGLIAMSGVN